MRQVANPDYDASAGESEDNPATLTQYAFFREVTEISGDIEITKLVFGGWASSVEAENDIEGKAIPEGAVFELITDMDGGFKVYGLGSGTYIFSETTTPNGYNTMDDIVFTIIPKYSDEEGHEGELVGLEVEIDGRREEIDIVKGDISVTEGNIPMTFANDRASSLPGTGGMGRKVFYVLGGVLVIGAFFILFGVSFQRRRPKSK